MLESLKFLSMLFGSVAGASMIAWCTIDCVRGAMTGDIFLTALNGLLLLGLIFVWLR